MLLRLPYFFRIVWLLCFFNRIQRAENAPVGIVNLECDLAFFIFLQCINLFRQVVTVRKGQVLCVVIRALQGKRLFAVLSPFILENEGERDGLPFCGRSVEYQRTCRRLFILERAADKLAVKARDFDTPQDESDPSAEATTTW